MVVCPSLSVVHLPWVPHIRNLLYKKKKQPVPSVLTLAVALVIPLHGYFMIVFEICLVRTALPLLCLMATREFSFVLCFAIDFRRVFEVSDSYENNKVLCQDLPTSQSVFSQTK